MVDQHWTAETYCVSAWRQQWERSFTEKNWKCALNDSVFKFMIYSVEMQDLNTNTNLLDLFLVLGFGRTLTRNFYEYEQVFRIFTYLVFVKLF